MKLLYLGALGSSLAAFVSFLRVPNFESLSSWIFALKRRSVFIDERDAEYIKGVFHLNSTFYICTKYNMYKHYFLVHLILYVHL